MLKKEHCYDNIEELYHSDSSVVLSYLNNEARRFHTYVGQFAQLDDECLRTLMVETETIVN